MTCARVRSRAPVRRSLTSPRTCASPPSTSADPTRSHVVERGRAVRRCAAPHRLRLGPTTRLRGPRSVAGGPGPQLLPGYGFTGWAPDRWPPAGCDAPRSEREAFSSRLDQASALHPYPLLGASNRCHGARDHLRIAEDWRERSPSRSTPFRAPTAAAAGILGGAGAGSWAPRRHYDLAALSLPSPLTCAVLTSRADRDGSPAEPECR